MQLRKRVQAEQARRRAARRQCAGDAVSRGSGTSQRSVRGEVLTLYWIECFFFFQAEDGIRDVAVTGVQTCALPIYRSSRSVDPISLKCSWASAPRACAIYSNKERKTLPASSLSMRSMRLDGIVVQVLAAATMNVSRRSTNCWLKWTASNPTKVSF